MTAGADMRERIAGAFVLSVLALACLAWWIALPALTLWGLSHATEDGATHFVGGLLGVPLAMALTAPVLFWLNGLYLRVTGAARRAEADEAESGWRRQLRGPLEPIMLISLGVAFAAFGVWFVLFADNPSPSFW